MALKGKLRALRKAKGLTVVRLAQVSGVSDAYLRQLEDGRRDNPTGEILQKISAALGTTVADLLGESLAISEGALDQAPDTLREWVERRGEVLDVRQEDIEMLAHVHYRGRRPERPEDWELIFTLIKRLLE